MIKKLIKKYQAYKDRKFHARLERVMQNNIVKSSMILGGNIIMGGDIALRIPRTEMENILKGTPSDSGWATWRKLGEE